MEIAAPSFLQASLTKAVYALNAYEINNGSHAVTSGAVALSSLINNGTVYGANMASYMGGYTIASYANVLKAQGAAKGLTVTLSNANTIVFQNSPGQLTVTLSSQLNVSSPYGTVSYPISLNTSIPLTGLPDLYGGSLGRVP